MNITIGLGLVLGAVLMSSGGTMAQEVDVAGYLDGCTETGDCLIVAQGVRYYLSAASSDPAAHAALMEFAATDPLAAVAVSGTVTPIDGATVAGLDMTRFSPVVEDPLIGIILGLQGWWQQDYEVGAATVHVDGLHWTEQTTRDAVLENRVIGWAETCPDGTPATGLIMVLYDLDGQAAPTCWQVDALSDGTVDLIGLTDDFGPLRLKQLPNQYW